jgi:hypothetical protein
MLVLRDLVVNGQVPLLGPATSIGDFHHGVLYYFLLAPVAALSSADPVWVTAFIALCGTVAVVVTWWLARSIGGPLAGLVAGLLLAVSASAVEESTFIWNPNLIALSSSVALAAAWRGRDTGRAGWWVVAALGVIVTMHCHVLGSILVVPVGGLYALELRRRPSRALAWAGVAAVLLALARYLPLLIYELDNEFLELRAVAAFFAGGGAETTALPIRVVIVGLRVLAWPLAGLITNAPAAAIIAAALAVALTVWRATRPADGRERFAARWLGLSLVWTIAALAVAASGLASVVPGLPNDHYHAFADPIVVIVVALGLAALVREAGSAGPGLAGATLVALVGWNAVHQPPLVAADGGWPAADAAAARIQGRIGDKPTDITGLPSFKAPDALVFPLIHRGAAVSTLTDMIGLRLVVLCDNLFRDTIGASCGGPAEDELIQTLGIAKLSAASDRFEAAPGRWVSVYLPR